MSSGSLVFVGFIRASPGGRRVHSGSLGSFGWSGSFGFVGFIRSRPVGFLRACPRGRLVISVRWVHPSAVWGCLVHSGAPWGSSGSTAFVWFIRVGRRIHSGVPRWSSGSFRLVGLVRALPGCRRVLSCSLGSLRRALGVVGFIRVGWVHSGAQWGTSDSVVRFIRARHGGLGFIGARL